MCFKLKFKLLHQLQGIKDIIEAQKAAWKGMKGRYQGVTMEWQLLRLLYGREYYWQCTQPYVKKGCTCSTSPINSDWPFRNRKALLFTAWLGCMRSTVCTFVHFGEAMQESGLQNGPWEGDSGVECASRVPMASGACYKHCGASCHSLEPSIIVITFLSEWEVGPSKMCLETKL